MEKKPFDFEAFKKDAERIKKGDMILGCAAYLHLCTPPTSARAFTGNRARSSMLRPYSIMNRPADHCERCFKVAARRPELICINGERCAQYNKRRSV